MDWRADFNCGPMEAQHTGAICGDTSLVCARRCARVASSILAAVMVRYAASLRAADTKSSVANRAPRAFTSHSLEHQDWYFTGWEWMTIRL